jgi:hypothetical protein
MAVDLSEKARAYLQELRFAVLARTILERNSCEFALKTLTHR